MMKDLIAAQKQRLEVEASWEVHRAMPLDPDATNAVLPGITVLNHTANVYLRLKFSRDDLK